MLTVFNKYGVELKAGNPHNRRNDGGAFTRLDYDYELYADGKLICKGDDFSPPGFRDVEYYVSVSDLLGFLTLRPGDTDDEFFARHSPEHLEWLDTIQADDVRIWIYDIENQD